MVHLRLSGILNECPDVFSAPDRGARAELERFGIAPCRAAFPPRALTDGKEFQNLMEPEKTRGGYLRCHNPSSVLKWFTEGYSLYFVNLSMYFSM